MSEKTIWKGSPSQWTNFKTFLACGISFLIIISLYPLSNRHISFWVIGCLLTIPLYKAIKSFLDVKYWQIEITSERYIIKHGIFSRQTRQVEFYRVKDVVLYEPFLLRMVGLSTLKFISTDRVASYQFMPGLPDGEKLKDEIRRAIEEVRERKQVYVGD